MDKLIGVAMETAGELNGKEVNDYGELTGIDSKFVVNHADESGIGIKGQLLLAGPTLESIKTQGSQLWEDKDGDDLYIIASIRTKGDPQEVIDGIKGLIQDFGIPIEEMAAQFGDLKFHAGDGEALIGFKAQDNQYTEMINNFLLNSSVFGDGSEEVTSEFSFNIGTTFSEMLDDQPLFKHLLKSLSVELKGHIFEGTRKNILEVLEGKKDDLGPILSALHALFLVKNVKSNIEIETTEESIEKLSGSLKDTFPMGALSLKEIFAMVKGAGLPIDMFKPILELISANSAGELNISAFAQAGIKFTLRTPGLDEAIGAFLED
mgnify:CR=1 FL=1